MSFAGGVATGILGYRLWAGSKETLPAETVPATRRPRQRKLRTGGGDAASGPADTAVSGPLLSIGDRDRLAEWMIETEKALENTGSLNRAWSSRAMVQIKTWLDSGHDKPQEAVELVESFRQVLLDGLIRSAELTGPILVKLRESAGGAAGESGEVSSKLAVLRQETGARLTVIRERCAGLPVSQQNEFHFT